MHIAIDLWDKRCGLAIELEGVVVPKQIVPRVEIVSFLKKLFLEYSVTTIVVGLPYDLYGKQKKQLEKTEKFIEKLKNIFPEKNIIGFDERFSSFWANIYIENMQEQKWGKRDDISAQIILEDYLRNT